MSVESSNSTNPSLIQRIRNDDSSAWRELVELYTPLIAHWCRKKGLQPPAIQDCIQDVFYAVLKSLVHFRPNGTTGCFRAWLWTITRNKIVDSVRKDERSQSAEGGTTGLVRVLAIPDMQDEDEPTDGPSFNQLIHRALNQVVSIFL